MKNKSALSSGMILSLLVLVTACSPSASSSSTADTLVAPPAEGESGAPTLAATAAPANNPSGILVARDSEDSLGLYDTSGQLTELLQAPGISNPNPNNVCLTGSAMSGNSTISVEYHSRGDQAGLMRIAAGQVDSLRQTDSLAAFACAHGQEVLAFSEVSVENGIPHSALYAGNTDNLSMLTPFLTRDDQDTQTVLMPVGLKAAGNDPKGVYYTYSAWGVGGLDQVFPVTRGLFYYNLTAQRTQILLDESRSFQGLSPDMHFVGSVDFQPDGDRSMLATDLSSGHNIHFDLKTGSERGAGYASFSPENQYIAWMEGSGSFSSSPDDFVATVRIGNLGSGKVVAETNSSAAAKILGIEKVSLLKPVGWLNEHSLLLEAVSSDWDQSSLLLFDLDTQAMSLFCQGTFLGFAYP